MTPSRNPTSSGRVAGALVFAVLAWTWPHVLPAPLAAAEPEQPKEIIAAQIRKQGYACEKPQSAERDPEASEADKAAWGLRCENATYRVRLIPTRAAHVERID